MDDELFQANRLMQRAALANAKPDVQSKKVGCRVLRAGSLRQ